MPAGNVRELEADIEIVFFAELAEKFAPLHQPAAEEPGGEK